MDRQSSLFLDLLALLEPVEQFMDKVKGITALQSLNVIERIRMIREAGSALLRDMEGSFETFSQQLEERKKELRRILNPPKLNLIEQMRQLLMEMSTVIRKIELREVLRDRWEAESPEEILRDYTDSVAAQETLTVEMFEAYAEDILERKCNEAARAAWERARELRLTPDQLRAREELRELERLGTSLRAILSDIASTLRNL